MPTKAWYGTDIGLHQASGTNKCRCGNLNSTMYSVLLKIIDYNINNGVSFRARLHCLDVQIAPKCQALGQS